MATPDTWQPRFQVNTGTAATGTQSAPKIIGLDNGNTVVVWIEDAAGAVSSAAGRNIVAKVFDSEGNVVIDATALTTSFSGLDETDFDIAATNNAGFVIGFVGEDLASPNNSSLIHARFDHDLNLVNSGALESETTATEGYDEVSIAYDHLADLSIVSFTKTETSGDTEIYTYAVSNLGVSGAATKMSNAANPSYDSDVAILSDGNYLTVFKENSVNEHIFSSVYKPDGTYVSGLGDANSPNTLASPSAASFNGGGHVVAIQNNVDPFVFITFDNLAMLLGATANHTVFDDSTGPATDTQVVVLPDGDYVVAWIDGGGNNELRALRYNPDSSEDGDIMEVTLADGGVTPDTVSDYRMSVSADGRLLFTWVNFSDGEIYAAIFDPRDATIDVADYQTNTTNFIDTSDVVGRVDGGTINGDANANILIGLDGQDTLNGEAGNDTLKGGGANDLIDGGTGADQMEGGTGNDFYLVDNTGDTVSETGGGGNDTVQSSVSFTLASGVEDLILSGSGNTNGTGNGSANTLTGNGGSNSLAGSSGNDTLTGAGGADTLDGGTGADAMNGGTGNDFYMVDNTGDTVSETGGGGNDTVQSSVSFTLASGVEDLIFSGSGNANGTGNGSANTLTGNGGSNSLAGSSGNDTLIGAGGADTLDGGTGADAMNGGTGNDLYKVDNSGDTVSETGGNGTDTVQSTISFTLGNGLENLVLTGSGNTNGTGNGSANTLTGNGNSNNLAGSSGNDTLTGAGGADTLDGGTGADAMNGGTGNDLYKVDNTGDTVSESGGNGTDTVQSSVSFTLGGGVENLILSGSGKTNGIGNGSANTLTGNGNSNNLAGSSGNDTLTGGGGADTLNGGGGADSMNGGDGGDFMVVDHAGDRANGGAGVDKVNASVSHTLSAGTEHLTLTGGGKTNGTGNGSANALTGNSNSNKLSGRSGNDTLTGGGGADTLDGGGGRDTMNGGNGGDFMVVDHAGDKANGGAGVDKVNASVSHTLSAGTEHLTLTGGGKTNGTGNGAANTIIGNGGANRLSGQGGNDTLTGNGGNDQLLGGGHNDLLVGGGGADLLNGGTGRDTLNGGNGNDLFVVDNAGDKAYGGAGIDKVNASVSHTLSAGTENLTLTGGGNTKGGGNGVANTIVGNGGKNLLSGKAGNDVLNGKNGNDTLNGGGQNDQLFGGGGKDTLKGDAGNDFLRGDGGNDRIIGGAGIDTAVYSGKLSKFAITKVGANVKVVDKTGGQGTDILSGVEKIKIGGTTLSVNDAISRTPNARDAPLNALPATAAEDAPGGIEWSFESGDLLV